MACLVIDFQSMSSYDTQGFRKACLDLLATGQERLLIDMRQARHQLPSGMLSAVMDLALVLGASPGELCRLRVMVSPEVAEQFRLLGISADTLEISAVMPGAAE